MPRRALQSIARLLVGALLFAQLAVAAYACPRPDAAAADNREATAAMPGCDEPMGTAALDPAAPNLCAEHCKAGQQSERASPTLGVPAAILTARYALPSVPSAPPPPRPAATSISALVAASPPHAIAHCVFRI
jgi:hypothetical protein